MEPNFRGAAKRLDEFNLPKLGATIGVGEDEIHALLDVETRGQGFDSQGRPIILFEPHVFYRNLAPGARFLAVKQGLAYPKWGDKPYPADSYPIPQLEFEHVLGWNDWNETQDVYQRERGAYQHSISWAEQGCRKKAEQSRNHKHDHIYIVHFRARLLACGRYP
ncbi:hypothetical protein Mesau_02727 [Mesorhizobium australicum WSM2073]|uniref:N-acetylmuramidase domain-containing protein n=1 Tax=Mesorhizobium australicum (strain HAMBI 3006 / LMG 24608 / WSM2073) TaxID=754035 RepID=L0KMA5_MESAW|nr:N-acetylmuramidase domain-containing protein [Mesorhizobium australicum]AGB45134.1 hypothetical protein Mesau_02727 [Mesorhizobium australicum WSM2073]